MIKRLTEADYGKRIACMTLAEKDAYAERVGKWLEAQAPLIAAKTQQPGADFQNAVQCSAVWNDAECAAWDEGVQLLTSLIGTADTWLPDMLYVKAAKRCIRRLVTILSEMKNETGDKDAAENDATTHKEVAAVPEKHERKPSDAVQLAPVRPKHIDQYVHLLPEATQERAAKVKQLLDALDSEREQARLLMSTGDAAARAQHMKAATKLDNQLRSIYRELDREWDKLVKSGRINVDDLGNVRICETRKEETPETEEKDEKPSLTSEQRERVRTLRHFLKDTRRGNGKTRDEHVRKWKESYAEMIAIAGAGAVTDKVREAAAHYGIDIASLEAKNEK